MKIKIGFAAFLTLVLLACTRDVELTPVADGGPSLSDDGGIAMEPLDASIGDASHDASVDASLLSAQPSLSHSQHDDHPAAEDNTTNISQETLISP